VCRRAGYRFIACATLYERVRQRLVISGGGRLPGGGVGYGGREYVEEGERVVDVLG
jgi:hypothetical protein